MRQHVAKRHPSSTERPMQTVNPAFAFHPDYDLAIPWSVFADTPAAQDFSIVSAASVYYADVSAPDTGVGSFESPFNDVQHAIDCLKPGDTLYFRGGLYKLARPIFIRDKRRVTLSSYGRELAIFDGSAHDGDAMDFDTENGIFTFDRCADVLLKNIRFQNSHCKGISVFNSDNVEISHCEVENTFACGIAIWDTSPLSEKQNAYRGFRILGNTIRKANTWGMIPKGRRREGEPPHEAISIAGATDFEVAYNHVFECDKEGIDIKENSRDGIVHHNYVHHCDRQGLYADAWFGTLANVIFRHNVVLHNRGAGLALSVEGEGSYLSNVTFDSNIVYGNWGSGFYVFRWGHDLLRENIVIRNNTFVCNGHGGSYGRKSPFWLTGGLHFYSGSIRNMLVENNICSDNATFEIGFSDNYGKDVTSIKAALAEKKIVLRNNLVDYRDHTIFPVTIGWPGNFSDVIQYDGDAALQKAPLFRDLEKGDFTICDPLLLDRKVGAIPFTHP